MSGFSHLFHTYAQNMFDWWCKAIIILNIMELLYARIINLCLFGAIFSRKRFADFFDMCWSDGMSNNRECFVFHPSLHQFTFLFIPNLHRFASFHPVSFIYNFHCWSSSHIKPTNPTKPIFTFYPTCEHHFRSTINCDSVVIGIYLNGWQIEFSLSHNERNNWTANSRERE